MSAYVFGGKSKLDYQPGRVWTRRDTVGVNECAQMKVGINYVGEVVLQLCYETVTGIHYVKQTPRQCRHFAEPKFGGQARTIDG